jgi:hypothetical protein
MCSFRRKPDRLLRRVLANVALRTSIGSPAQIGAVQLQQAEGVEERLGLVPPVAEQLEGSDAIVVATDDLAVDQAGAHLEVVHRLDH